MTRHTTIRRADVAGLLPRGDYTAGVPITAAQASAIITLVAAELCARKQGAGALAETDEAYTDAALLRLAALMGRAIADISVLRDTPQR